MEEECGRAWSVAELAQFAGLPRRTLQREFRRFFGKPPIQALRDIRFKRARRELLRASPTSTVADIATRCGFTHLARFAAEYQRRYRESPSATLRRRAGPLPIVVARPPHTYVSIDRPTLAVLPIEAAGDERWLARIVCEQLADSLRRGRVVAITDGTRARFCLAGRLRKDGWSTRLTLRLIDASGGRLLWASSFTYLPDEACAFEQRVADAVEAAIRPALLAAEMAHAYKAPMGDLRAKDFALRALPHVLALDRKSDALAIELLERAIDLDSHQPLALALAAWSHAQRVIYQFTDNPAQDHVRALQFAAKAASLAGNDATVLAILGTTYNAVHDLRTAEVLVGRALAVDGGSAWAWGRSAWIDSYLGRAEIAAERFKIALELAPDDPLAPSLHVGLGFAYFNLRKYPEAVRWLERAVAKLPSPGWAHRLLTPSYAHLGFHDKAAQSASALRREYPGITINQVMSALPMTETTLQQIAEGLESVGLPLA
jgi:AraC-like DNA-binding protein/tetratricopeptide (TPR) repeat protein